MIAIVDYGLGNIKAFANIYKRLDIPYKFVKTASDFQNSTHIILPGVGAFDFAMKRLNESGMRDALDELVLTKKIPVIGVCVGMQIMARGSEEGDSEGLGWFDTEVIKFKEDSQQYPLPHMGWNNIDLVNDCSLFNKLDTERRFYFLHSYHFKADYEHVIAVAEYSEKVGCVLNKENIYGIQCHPEKSHHNGVGILSSFSEV